MYNVQGGNENRPYIYDYYYFYYDRGLTCLVQKWNLPCYNLFLILPQISIRHTVNSTLLKQPKITKLFTWTIEEVKQVCVQSTLMHIRTQEYIL